MQTYRQALRLNILATVVAGLIAAPLGLAENSATPAASHLSDSIHANPRNGNVHTTRHHLQPVHGAPIPGTNPALVTQTPLMAPVPGATAADNSTEASKTASTTTDEGWLQFPERSLPDGIHPYVTSFPTPQKGSITRNSIRNSNASPKPNYTANKVHQPVDMDLAQRMDELMRCALAKSPEVQEYDRALAKYGKSTQKSKFGIKDLGLNYFGFPRGFDASEEGAHIVLNQTAQAKSLEAATLGKQLKIDSIHTSIVASLLELALGLGCPNSADSQRHIKEARDTLDNLVGTEESDRTLQMLVQWTQAEKITPDVFKQYRWDLHALQNKTRLASQLSCDNDPLVLGLRNKLHKIGDHSRTTRVGSKVLEGTVSGLTMLGPGLGVPIAAQAINAGWGLANGGSEEAKLLREIYFQKQLESREQTLSNEALSALLNYREAVETNNAPLLICSEALIAQLVGAVGVPQIIDRPVLAHGTFVNHSIESASLKESTH